MSQQGLTRQDEQVVMPSPDASRVAALGVLELVPGLYVQSSPGKREILTVMSSNCRKPVSLPTWHKTQALLVLAGLGATGHWAPSVPIMLD